MPDETIQPRTYREHLAADLLVAIITHDGLGATKPDDLKGYAEWQSKRCFAIADGFIAALEEERAVDR